MGKEKSDMQNKDEDHEKIENHSNNSDLDSNNVLDDKIKEKAFDIFYKSLEKNKSEEIFEKIQKEFDITLDEDEKENWEKLADRRAEEYLEGINKSADKKQAFDAFYEVRKECYYPEAIQETAEKCGIDSKSITDWDDKENWEKLRKQKKAHIFLGVSNI